MKANNKEKIKKSKIVIGTFGLTSSVAFGIVAPVVINANKHSSSKNTIANNLALKAPAPIGTEIGPSTNPTNKAPKYIYSIAPIDNNQLAPTDDAGKTHLNTYLTNILNSLSGYQLTRNQDLTEKFIDAYKDIMVAVWSPTLSTNGSITADAQNGKKMFSDVSTMFDNYNKINNLGQQVQISEKLSIIKPTEIRDVTSYNYAAQPGAADAQTLLKADEFSYKVAEVDLAKLSDQGSLGFTFNDKSQSDATNHDYRLIISNENKEEIKDFIANGGGDINKLFEKQIIFARDMKATATSPDETKNNIAKDFSKKVKFVLEPNNKLAIMVVPDDQNKDENSNIEFGVDTTTSGKDAVKNTTLKYGLLDNSLSPKHIKTWSSISDQLYVSSDDPIDPSKALIPSDPKLTANKVSLFSGKANFKNNHSYKGANTNWLRVYMAQGTKLSQQLQFNAISGADAFESQNNKLDIEYTGGSLINVTPKDVTITATAAGQTLPSGASLVDSKFFVNADFADIAQGSAEKYAKVDIALSRNIISFDADPTSRDENNFSIPSPASRIFFEDPFAKQISQFADAMKTEIRTQPKTEITDRHFELIGDIWKNWAGYKPEHSTITSNFDPKMIWPIAQNGQMVFDENIDKSDELKKFVYQYQHFFVDAQGRIKSDQQKQFGLFQADINQNFILDANGNKQEIETTGAEIYKHFVDYTNKLTQWSIDKLGLDSTFGIDKIDRYALTKPGDAMGFAKTRLISQAGKEGEELTDVAEMLVRLWVGDALTTNEEALKEKVEKEFSQFMPEWENAIKSKAKPATPGATVNENSDEYKISKQYIYAVLQPYFSRMISKVLEVETTKFETNLKLSLKTAFGAFMTDSNGQIKVNPTLINQVTTQDQNLSNMHLVSLGSYGTLAATDGKESLKSLIEFIYNAGLQTRFLKDSDLDVFNKYAANDAAMLDDQTIFEQDKQPEFVKLMQAVSTIMEKTFVNKEEYISFNEIIEKIQDHAYDRSQGTSPEKDLAATIRYAIETIATDRTFNSLSILGTSADITYLESLVIGKNIHEIFTEFLRKIDPTGTLKTEEVTSIKDFLDQQKQYDVNALTNLAVSLGNYNLAYFVDSLTKSSKIEATASEMLQQDLSKQIRVSIDSDNQLIDFLSNPQNLVKYAFIGIGAGATAIGGSVFGLSFRKSVRTSRKNIILERAVFIGIATVGIALALFGIIPGLL